MLDELVAVVIDHAIAIEDDEFHAASLEISENRFIALRISVRSARRFSRSFLSSVMTMTASKNESTGLFRDARLSDIRRNLRVKERLRRTGGRLQSIEKRDFGGLLEC